jgi:hypothetical protein
MAYVSYLYMEKAYRASTEPAQIPILINTLTVERGIQVSVEDLNQSEQIDWQDTFDTISVFTNQFEESGNHDCSRPSTPIQEAASVDRWSIASSVPSIIRETEIMETSEAQTFPPSDYVQESNHNNQQFSPNSSTTKKVDKQIKSQRDQHYPKKRVNQISARHEGQPLMSSTPVDSEDEDNPPKRPEKNDTKTTPNSCNKIKSTAV